MAAKHSDTPWLKILGVGALWAVGSTVIGYAAALLSGLGHAGLMFVWASWLVALAGFPIHLVYMIRKRPLNGKAAT